MRDLQINGGGASPSASRHSETVNSFSVRLLTFLSFWLFIMTRNVIITSLLNPTPAFLKNDDDEWRKWFLLLMFMKLMTLFFFLFSLPLMERREVRQARAHLSGPKPTSRTVKVYQQVGICFLIFVFPFIGRNVINFITECPQDGRCKLPPTGACFSLIITRGPRRGSTQELAGHQLFHSNFRTSKYVDFS